MHSVQYRHTLQNAQVTVFRGKRIRAPWHSGFQGMDAVRGEDQADGDPHVEVMIAQPTAAQQASLPNGVQGTREGQSQDAVQPQVLGGQVTSSARGSSDVRPMADGIVMEQASASEQVHPFPVATADRQQPQPANLETTTTLQQVELPQATTTSDAGQTPDAGIWTGMPGPGFGQEFLTPRSGTSAVQNQGTWIGRNVMDGFPRWMSRLGSLLALVDPLLPSPLGESHLGVRPSYLDFR